MIFRDRTEAGSLLAKKLGKYRTTESVVLGIPRGGAVTAFQVADYLKLPLSLEITRKIGHPSQPELAIAAVSEYGDTIYSPITPTVDPDWIKQEIIKQKRESERRRKLYLGNRPPVMVENKTAIIVDDGVATGLTLKAAVADIKRQNPANIVIAVPVISRRIKEELENEGSTVISLEIPEESEFLGAVGSYYRQFQPVEDKEVISLLNNYDASTESGSRRGVSKDPILFSFPIYRYLETELLSIPQFSSGKFKTSRYQNSEIYTEIGNTVSGKECIILGSISPPETSFFTFIELAHTIKKEGASAVTALIPYLSYSRHDKKEPGKSYATSLVGSVFSGAGIDRLITVDIHSSKTISLYPIPVVSISPARQIAEEIRKLNIEVATLVAPDEGAIDRVDAVARELDTKWDTAYTTKYRTEKGIVHRKITGNIHKTAIIIDDILDTGTTLVSCSKILKAKGAEEIYIFVTHGLFSGKKWKELWGLGVNIIFVSDSSPLPEDIFYGNIKVFSIIPLILEFFNTKPNAL